jgi:hypothetical protein
MIEKYKKQKYKEPPIMGILTYMVNIAIELPPDFPMVTGDITQYRRNFHLPYDEPILLAETVFDGDRVIRRREFEPPW